MPPGGWVSAHGSADGGSLLGSTGDFKYHFLNMSKYCCCVTYRQQSWSAAKKVNRAAEGMRPFCWPISAAFLAFSPAHCACSQGDVPVPGAKEQGFTLSGVVAAAPDSFIR